MNAVSSLQNTYVDSSSNGGGLVSSTNANSTANLGGTTQSVVGKNASVQAQTVSILANLHVGARHRSMPAPPPAGFSAARPRTPMAPGTPSVLAEIAAGGTNTVAHGHRRRRYPGADAEHQLPAEPERHLLRNRLRELEPKPHQQPQLPGPGRLGGDRHRRPAHPARAGSARVVRHPAPAAERLPAAGALCGR